MIGIIYPYRFLLAVVLVFLPLFFYQIYQSIDPNKTQFIRFDIITVAGILGGLVMTVATSGRINRRVRRKYLMVAIAFLLATILLVIAAVNFTWFGLQGEIDLSVIEWSSGGFVRWYSFWVTVIGFYGGMLIFAYALIDLLFVLWYTVNRQVRVNSHGGHTWKTERTTIGVNP